MSAPAFAANQGFRAALSDVPNAEAFEALKGGGTVTFVGRGLEVFEADSGPLTEEQFPPLMIKAFDLDLHCRFPFVRCR